MKKLSILICLLVLFSASAVFAAEASEAVTVTDFKFLVNDAESNVISGGDTLSTSFKLRKNENSELPENFVAVLQIVKQDEVIKAVVKEGSISYSDGEKEFKTDVITVGEDIAYCDIVFHLVSDLESFTPLAPTGTFNCTNPLIHKVKIENSRFYYEDSSVYTSLAPRVIPLLIWANELPVEIYIEPADLSTKLTYNDVTENGGILTVNSVSHSGTTSETVADIRLDIPSKDQLKSISVSGVPIDGFSKDKYEYVVTVEGTEIPEITYEKVDEGASASYTPPAQLPGKAEIAVSAEGSEKKYTVIFAKKVNAPLVHAGYKRTGTNGINVYDASSLPSTRTILTNDENYADYANRRVYLEFASDVLPANSVVASGTLKLKMKNANANTQFTVDVFTALDKDWYSNSLNYKAMGTYPRESDVLAYSGTAPVITSDEYSEIVYNLNPAVFGSSADGYNLVLRQTYNSESSGMNTISFAEGDIPAMDLYYYINE